MPMWKNRRKSDTVCPTVGTKICEELKKKKIRDGGGDKSKCLPLLYQDET